MRAETALTLGQGVATAAGGVVAVAGALEPGTVAGVGTIGVALGLLAVGMAAGGARHLRAGDRTTALLHGVGLAGFLALAVGHALTWIGLVLLAVSGAGLLARGLSAAWPAK
jgi:hypothetical protein